MTDEQIQAEFARFGALPAAPNGSPVNLIDHAFGHPIQCTKQGRDDLGRVYLMPIAGNDTRQFCVAWQFNRIAVSVNQGQAIAGSAGVVADASPRFTLADE